jgi:hypothetical protein
MDCSDFLRAYSDYRDRLITDPAALRRFRIHLIHCGPCALYDESVRRGVGALDQIEPSSGFRTRLRARLAGGSQQRGEPGSRRAASRLAAALMLAAAIALVVYSRRDRHSMAEPASALASGVDAVIPPLASDVPQSLPLVVVNPGVPFVTFTGSSPTPFHLVGSSQFPFPSPSVSSTSDWASLPR